MRRFHSSISNFHRLGNAYRDGCVQGGLCCLVVVFVVLVALAATTGYAEDESPEVSAGSSSAEGLFVQVQVPITDSSERAARQSIQLALEELVQGAEPDVNERPTLIIEFAAGAEAGAGSDFGKSYKLARFIADELGAIETVAFIPHSLSGHAVLPVMACDQVVMAADAYIGRAGRDEDSSKPIARAVEEAYREISQRRRTFPLEVALGMLDKQHEVLLVKTEGGPEIVFRQDLDDLLARTSEVPGSRREVIIDRGEFGWIPSAKARSWGLIPYLADDRLALVDELGLPREVVLGRRRVKDINPRMLTVKSYIDARLSDSRRRMIDNCLRDDVNYICFWMESEGGDINAALALANSIAKLDSDDIRTVAYIPSDARGAAALVALACDQVYMRPDAHLDGGDEELTEEGLADVTSFFRDQLVAEKQRRWSLPVGMFDPAMIVDAYRHRDSGRVEYFTKAELDSTRDARVWIKQQTVSPLGETVSLDGETAAEFGLAADVVDSFDEFKVRERLEGDVSLVEPGWTDELVTILASPQIASLLLLIGLVGMYAEVQMPGIGIGGFVAAIAFVFFFWANYMEQTANTLEILLFLVGVSCLVLEIFVIPGFGIFGLGGGLLVIVSLVLASQTFILPHTDAEIRQLRDSLLVVGSSGVLFIGAAMVMRRFLPKTPLFRHILLEPPGSEHPEELSQREAMVDYRHLEGEQGVAATQLTPAGKARVGDLLVDVVSDGELIEKGQAIRVSEVHGNRVVVRSVEE